MLWNKPKEYPNLQAAIDRVMDDMTKVDPNSEEYTKLLSSLERLNALRAPRKPRGFSPDTVLTTAGYVLGVIIIVAYEHGHVLASKATGHLPKPQ